MAILELELSKHQFHPEGRRLRQITTRNSAIQAGLQRLDSDTLPQTHFQVLDLFSAENLAEILSALAADSESQIAPASIIEPQIYPIAKTALKTRAVLWNHRYYQDATSEALSELTIITNDPESVVLSRAVDAAFFVLPGMPSPFQQLDVDPASLGLDVETSNAIRRKDHDILKRQEYLLSHLEGEI